MAIAQYVISCDHCEEIEHDLESDGEATERGWFIVKAAERYVGGNGERAFCSVECLQTFFA